MSPNIEEFKGKNRFLSNFWPVQIEYQGILYPSTEHAYQAAKTLDKDDRIEVSQLSKAGDAKRFGKDLKLRDDWEQVKQSVMLELLRIKFSDRDLRDKLLGTGDRLLIEGNNWHDNYWGICYCKNCTNKDSQNILGKLLMKVRREINEINTSSFSSTSQTRTS